jgi:hypothetical protein
MNFLGRTRFYVGSFRGLDVLSQFSEFPTGKTQENLLRRQTGGDLLCLRNKKEGEADIVALQMNLSRRLHEQVAAPESPPSSFITREADDKLQSRAFRIEDGKIVEVYRLRHPDKPRHVHANGASY